MRSGLRNQRKAARAEIFVSIDLKYPLYIVSGCIGIIKSSQQLTLNHSVFRPARQQSTVNSQQSTVNNSGGVQPKLISFTL
jgi:hypothetical protein